MIGSLKRFLRGTLGLPPGLVLLAGGAVLHVLTCLLMGWTGCFPQQVSLRRL